MLVVGPWIPLTIGLIWYGRRGGGRSEGLCSLIRK